MYRLIERFLSDNERASILDAIERQAPAFVRTGGRRGVGPRYSVMDGEVVAARMPLIADLAERIRPLAEELGEMPLALFGDPKRCMRVQRYEEREDGFRWHFDGHPLAAIVTLENESNGTTEVIDPATSRLVKPLFYAGYALPQLASLAPRREIAMKAGDALLLRGRESLHRGRSRRNGRRTILVFGYDRPGARPGRWRNRLARLLNF